MQGSNNSPLGMRRKKISTHVGNNKILNIKNSLPHTIIKAF